MVKGLWQSYRFVGFADGLRPRALRRSSSLLRHSGHTGPCGLGAPPAWKSTWWAWGAAAGSRSIFTQSP